MCVCNRKLQGKLADLCRHAELVTFQRPPQPKMVQHFLAVARKEGLPLSEAQVRGLVVAARGDMRQVYLTMQLNASGGSGGAVVACEKDEQHDVESATRALLSGPTLDEAMELHHVDALSIPMMLQENYPDLAGSLQTTAAIADHLSWGDVVERHMHCAQLWQLERVHSAAVVGAPCVLMARQEQRKLRVSTMWSKVSNCHTREKTMHRLRTALRERNAECGLQAVQLLRASAWSLIGAGDHAALGMRSFYCMPGRL